MTPAERKERLRRRQQQEHADKGKTGLGRVDILDFSVIGDRVVNQFNVRYDKGEKNVFDILPFVVTQSWYAKLRRPSGRPTGVEIGDIDYKLLVPVHRGMGPDKRDSFVCNREAFGEPCYRCDAMFEAYNEGDKDKGNQLRSSWTTFYNVYDYDDTEKDIQLWRIAYYNFECTTTREPQRANLIDAQALSDGGIEIFSDLEEGKTLVVKFQKQVLGKNEFPVVFDIQFEGRETYDESILNDVYPFDKMLIIPTADDVKASHLGLDADGNPPEKSTNEPAAETETKPRTRTRGTPPAAKEEPIAEAEDGVCPSGGNWGESCNALSECQTCPENTFNVCLEEYNRMTAKENSPPIPEPETKPKPEPETKPEPEPDQPRRRRRGKA